MSKTYIEPDDIPRWIQMELDRLAATYGRGVEPTAIILGLRECNLLWSSMESDRRILSTDRLTWQRGEHSLPILGVDVPSLQRIAWTVQRGSPLWKFEEEEST